MFTSIQISDEDIQTKKDIEASLNGAKLSHNAVYHQGLIALKSLMEKRVKVNLSISDVENVENE